MYIGVVKTEPRGRTFTSMYVMQTVQHGLNNFSIQPAPPMVLIAVAVAQLQVVSVVMDTRLSQILIAFLTATGQVDVMELLLKVEAIVLDLILTDAPGHLKAGPGVGRL